MGPNKAVHLMFLSGGVIAFFLLTWTAEWIASYFVKNPNEWLLQGCAAIVTLVVGVMAYRNERLNTAAHEVAGELEKVTWPTKKETQAATIVVIVTTLVAALILGLFDLVWSSLTDLIYG